MSGPRLIVLGRTGQLARELIRLAPEAGWTVTALGRETADFNDPAACARALRAAGSAEAVINAVAYTGVDAAETDQAAALRVNAETPGRLADVCARVDAPFAHVSTDYVFSGALDRPYREDDPTGPRSVYGATKLAGERAVAEAGGRHLIVRTAWVYSPHGRNFVKTMLRAGREREVLRVVDDQTGCPTAADDLARGLLTAASAMARGENKTGVYHLAGRGAASWADFADAILDLAEPVWGRRPRVERIASEAYPTPAPRPRNSRLDSARFAKDFSFAPDPWPQGLARVVAALREAEPALFDADGQTS